MSNTQRPNIQCLLQSFIDSQPHSISSEVAQEALQYHCPEQFFHDLIRYGCQNGIIASLTYYADTAEFFDRHYDEIEDIRLAYQEESGIPFHTDGDWKNALAWFAFESVAWQIAQHIGIPL